MNGEGAQILHLQAIAYVDNYPTIKHIHLSAVNCVAVISLLLMHFTSKMKFEVVVISMVCMKIIISG